MFRFLVPRQHRNLFTTTSLVSKVLKDSNTSEPFKFATGTWNSSRFVETGKGLPGGTIRQMGGGMGKMAVRNEEEYFYKKTKGELDELKKRIRTEAITPPVKRKLEQEALNLDLQLKRMDLRSVIDRAVEGKSKALEHQADILSKQQKPLEEKPQLKNKTELKESPVSLKRVIEQLQGKTEPKQSEVNKIHYAEGGQSPVMQPTNSPVNKEQQKTEMKQLQSRPGTQPEQPEQKFGWISSKQHSLRKRLERGQEEGLKTIKEDLTEIRDKVNLVDKLKNVPKEGDDHMPKKVKPLMRQIDSKKLGRRRKSGAGRLKRSSELQKAIREAEIAYKNTKKKE